MKRLGLLLSTLFILSIINPFFAQTCISSGGDDDLDLEPRYRLRCGGSMRHDGMYKSSHDYKIIEDCSNYYSDGNYFRKKGKVYYSKEYGSFELIAGANEKSFRCEEGTAKDDNNIYFLGKAVTDVSKASFKSVGYAYCADDKNVYYRNKYSESGKLLKMENAESSSFELIGELESNYAKDSGMAYFSGQPIPLSDPSSFIVLAYGYVHDKNYVYYNGVQVEGMNGATFKVLKDCFLGSDGVSLCNGSKMLKNSDAQSFHAIECGYYLDNNNVYLNGVILEGVDSESFQILSWGYTKDKNAVYCDLQLITGANALSFKVLGRKHAKDNQHIFYLDQTMQCDYNSFELDSSLDYMSKDKNNTYKKGIRYN